MNIIFEIYMIDIIVNHVTPNYFLILERFACYLSDILYLRKLRIFLTLILSAWVEINGFPGLQDDNLVKIMCASKNLMALRSSRLKKRSSRICYEE